MRPTLPLHKGSTFKKRRAFKHLKGSVWPEIVTGLFLLMSVAATIHLVRPHWFGRKHLNTGNLPPIRAAALTGLQNLVLVACHAVFIGSDYSNAEDLASWQLLPYQQVPGQTNSFLQHMQMGIGAAANDPNALLVFSGGQTRLEAGARSEGQSYWSVSDAHGWFGHPGVQARAVTEEHARDSFENLMFSICRFREVTGHYPRTIVVASFEFKHSRFATMHREALRWPLDRFRFLGSPALSVSALQVIHARGTS
mmetsp:Transcript_18462/g.55712  ORF Transcript_18462/g.55712 Transcript_18462/m.55712 type:complete len:253 (-) Transcript_18462:868-1626(-)